MSSQSQAHPPTSTDVTAPPRRVVWSHATGAVAVLATALGTIYWEILRDLTLQWRDDPNYSHGFLVPLFSGWVVWRDRATLEPLSPRGSLLGLIVLLGGIGVLLLGDLAAENFLMRSSLIIILAGLVLFLSGRETFRLLLFPLAFLFFMMPLPAILLYSVTFPLQRFAAEQAAWVLDLLGVPVLLDGNVIQLSQLSLGVTEACSGIRSLISLGAGALAWAYMMLPRGWLSVAFVASAVPITIVANIGRVVTTGLIAEWFGADYAAGFFHQLAGWVVYMFAFACLIVVHGFIRLWQQWQAQRPI